MRARRRAGIETPPRERGWIGGIRELSLIVVGVLVALFVDGIREDLEERRILENYLADVAAEIRENEQTLDIMQTRVVPRNAAALLRVVASLRTPAVDVADTASLFEDLALSALTIRPWLTDDRYQALRSSGTLRLVRDPGLAGDLAGFHQGPSILFAMAEENRDGYRTLVNEIVPLELADGLSQMQGYSGIDLELFPKPPAYGPALVRLRERRAEFLDAAGSEAAYAAAYGHALARHRENAESMLGSLEPWARDEPEAAGAAEATEN